MRNNTIDFVLTNIIDHLTYPEKFCSEMERIHKIGGHIIIHIQKGIYGDLYYENMINDSKVIIDFFKFCSLVENRSI